MDRVSKSTRSANMKAIRSKAMKPEMLVRRMIYGMGYRYRLHRKDLPGKPDLVFASQWKIIFVHGCFWHQHPDPSCKIVHRPRSNIDYWLPKFEKNRARDEENRKALESAGWEVLVIWECQLKEPGKVKERIRFFLKK